MRHKYTHRGLLVIVVSDKFDDDLLLGLDLKHLHDEAHKWRGLTVATEGPSNVVELHSLVD